MAALGERKRAMQECNHAEGLLGGRQSKPHRMIDPDALKTPARRRNS